MPTPNVDFAWNHESEMSRPADLTSAVFDCAERAPGSPAIASREGVLSYRQLAALVQGTRLKLAQSGIQRGQVVGISARNSLGHLVLILALAAAGAVSVPLHFLRDHPRKSEAAKKLGLSTVFAERAGWGIEGLPTTLLADVLSNTSPDSGEDCDRDGVNGGRIFFSSGSSGAPKAVLLDSKCLGQRIRQTLSVSRMDQSCRVLCGDLNDPMWAVQALAALYVGGTLVFPGPTIWNMCSALPVNAITHVRLAPHVLMAILGKLGDDGMLLPDLQRLEIVGAGPPKSLLDSVRRKMTDRLFVTYDMTELGIVSVAGPDQLASQPHSAGNIVQGVNLEVLDRNEDPLPIGETGMLRVSAPSMVDGYFADDAATERSFRNGWFYPGDAGRLDTAGRLRIAGRIDDRADLDSLAIDFRELEQAAMEFPGVKEAVALMIQRGTREQRLMVAVASREIPGGLLDYLGERFGQRGPDGIARLDEFPRTFNGKVARLELRKALETVSGNESAEPKSPIKAGP